MKTFYHLSEVDEDVFKERFTDDLMRRRPMSRSELSIGLRQLKKKQFVLSSINSGWILTEKGSQESSRLVRLHRLWEVYLSEYLNIAADHVHDDADAIEHVLTDELQEQLERVLEGRTTDPHDKEIPKSGD